MTRSRCTYTGCRKYSRPGEDRCTEHKGRIDRPDDVAPSAFELALNTGSYRDQLGRLEEDIRQAAAESGVTSEIGVLRMVMMRLMAEESDPAKLASGIAKLAGVVIQAQRAQRVLSGESADTLTDAVATILEELNP